MAFAPSLAFDYLRRADQSGRLGHAYLVTGGQNATFRLATRLAALVARTGGGGSDGEGVDPAAVLANPDVHVVEPESKSRRIVIEQMRELEGALRLRASVAGARKVGIVREADRLQPQAANAFLKTLEEPPAGSLLLLLSAQPESIMETILSRCIKVSLRDAPAGEEGGETRTREEDTLLELLARYARERSAGGSAAGSLPVAYRMAREFSSLLSAAKTRIQAEAEGALKREEARYAQTTDGAWLAERETYYKSVTEARYAGERIRLVSALARWWGDVLRAQSTGGQGAGADAGKLAAVLSSADVLRRLSAIDDLRENIDRNIQEALALEVAFLRVFGA